MLLALLSQISWLVRVRGTTDKASIDNFVFRMHYRATTTIFFVCCILITANSLIGDPISCIPPTSDIPSSVFNNYCWVHSTFTLPELAGTNQHIFHGIGTPLGHLKQLKHAYYQWVPFVLFLQGICFYLPHFLWKCFEGGRISSLTEGIRGVSLGDQQDKMNALVKYIIDSLYIHRWYAAKYILCEILNFVNVLGNIFFINLFLKGAFLNFGPRVLEYASSDSSNATNIWLEVFPRVTKCTFYTFGHSGSIQIHDSLCVLALNILNEKIYIFLWFWLIFLTLISGLNVLYRMAMVIFPVVRVYAMEQRTRVARSANHLIRRLHLADYFMLCSLQRNMDILVFRDFLAELSEAIIPPKKVAAPDETLNLQRMYPNGVESAPSFEALNRRLKSEFHQL